MTCNFCARKVENTFAEKFMHVLQYHPEYLLARLEEIAGASYRIGANIADMMKGSRHAISNR